MQQTSDFRFTILQGSCAEAGRGVSAHHQPESDAATRREKYVAGARKLGVSPGRLEVDAVQANIAGCYGCGYCNIGCKWGKKLSMLDTVLP